MNAYVVMKPSWSSGLSGNSAYPPTAFPESPALPFIDVFIVDSAGPTESVSTRFGPTQRLSERLNVIKNISCAIQVLSIMAMAISGRNFIRSLNAAL